MSKQFVLIENVLNQLEHKLKELALWQEESPSAQALESIQPFCVDTLSFSEWLQWVFLVKMRIVIAHQLPLPKTSAIAPMAEEALKEQRDGEAQLIVLLQRFDEIICSQKE